MSKTHPLFLATLFAGSLLGLSPAIAQYTPSYPAPSYNPGYSAPPVYSPAAPQSYQLSDQQLDQLLGPVALYPDPLLSEVLAAATYPQDVLAAQQWLQYFPNPSEDDINNQPWDASVKALVHYPSVLQMLASQPDWMQSLGAAFANQQQEVTNSIQRLRAQAAAANTLASSQQQQVVNDNGVIEILPAQPNVIYVPSYDPDIVYVGHPGYNQPYITFGPAYGVGGWLDLGWDWHNHRIDRGYRWDRDWHHPVITHPEPWRHNPGRPLPQPRFFAPPPRTIDRGWDRGHVDDHRGAPIFDNRSHIDNRPDDHRGNERPVQGIPSHPIEVPRHVETPRPVETHIPEAPRHIDVPRPEPMHTPEPARPVGRPVQGLPQRNIAPIAQPGLVGHTEVHGGGGAPAFNGGGGGAASARGNASMHH